MANETMTRGEMLAEARRLEARARDQLEWGKWSISRASNDAVALRRAARGPLARRLTPVAERAVDLAMMGGGIALTGMVIFRTLQAVGLV